MKNTHVYAGQYRTQVRHKIDASYSNAKYIVEQLQTVINEAASFGVEPEEVSFNTEIEDDYGCTSVSAEAYYYRPATPEEIAEYQAAEKKRQEDVEIREKAEFERLKQKFTKKEKR